MSSRTDAAFAKRYEEDLQWYNRFLFGKSMPTEKQLNTIKQIEKRTGIPFMGTTITEASEYITAFSREK